MNEHAVQFFPQTAFWVSLVVLFVGIVTAFVNAAMAPSRMDFEEGIFKVWWVHLLACFLAWIGSIGIMVFGIWWVVLTIIEIVIPTLEQ